MKRTFSSLLFAALLALGACEGPAGPAGKDGLNGGAAAKGDKGDPGIKGDQGDRGPKGDTGAKGDKGDTGASGQGSPGLPGKDGTDGRMGQMGFTGAQGERGAMGAPGTAGGQGPQGDPGPSKVTEQVKCAGTLPATTIDVKYSLTRFSNGMGFVSGTVTDGATSSNDGGFLPTITVARPVVDVIFDTAALDNKGTYHLAGETITYTDPDLGAPLSFTLPAGSCVVNNF